MSEFEGPRRHGGGTTVVRPSTTTVQAAGSGLGIARGALAQKIFGRSTRSTASRRPCGARRRRRRLDRGWYSSIRPQRLRAQLVAGHAASSAPADQRGAAWGAGGRGAVRGVRGRCSEALVRSSARTVGRRAAGYAVRAQYGACGASPAARRVARRARGWRARGSSGSASAQRRRPPARRSDRRREDARQRRAAPRHPQQPRRERGRQDREGAIRRERALALVARVVARRRLARGAERDVERPERRGTRRLPCGPGFRRRDVGRPWAERDEVEAEYRRPLTPRG